MRWAAVESPYGPAPTTTASYGAAGTDRRRIVVALTRPTRPPPRGGRAPVALAPDLDCGEAIKADFGEESFRLVSGVGRPGDALSEARVPSERRIRPLRPLSDPRADLAVRVQEANRLPSTGNERLEQGGPAKARVLGDGSDRLPGLRHEAGHHAGPLSLGADPRFTRLDDRRKPDVLQGAGNLVGSSDRNAGRHRDSESLRNRERLLFVDSDGHRAFVRERDADAALQPRSMSA